MIIKINSLFVSWCALTFTCQVKVQRDVVEGWPLVVAHSARYVQMLKIHSYPLYECIIAVTIVLVFKA
jgi:hypothetical protein